MMKSRLPNHVSFAQPAFEAMLALEKKLSSSGLDHLLLELIKLRASQINGCAYCIHTSYGTLSLQEQGKLIAGCAPKPHQHLLTKADLIEALSIIRGGA